MYPNSFDTSFAQTIYRARYEHPEDHGWAGTTKRVIGSVSGELYRAPRAQQNIAWIGDLQDRLSDLMGYRKFIPGGRYLYAAGRDLHQCNNCLLLRAEDSREGWAELKYNAAMALMTGAGIGVWYGDVRAAGARIKRTGGESSGPLALMESVNADGRCYMQGGKRRSAIWAGLPWSHTDVLRFVGSKDWSDAIKAIKAQEASEGKDEFPAPMDHTNISVTLDDAFFAAYGNTSDPMHDTAVDVYWAALSHMLKHGEPGFTIDVGRHAGEVLRNACVPGYTEILTKDGYLPIENLVGKSVEIWNGEEWSSVRPAVTGRNRPLVSVLLDDGTSLTCTPNHKFVLANGERVEAGQLEEEDSLWRAEFPVVDFGVDAPVDAYTQGFYSGDGHLLGDSAQAWIYRPKYPTLERLKVEYLSQEDSRGRRRARFGDLLGKDFVPFDWSLADRLNWLAGLFDADGTVIERGGIQLATVDPEFARKLRKLLTTVGAVSKIRVAQPSRRTYLPDGKGGQKLYDCKELERVLIPASSVQRMIEAGLVCSRLELGSAVGDIRRNSRFVRVIDVIPAGSADEVFCFTESSRNMGVFEGILTGQCTEITSADDSDVCNLGSLVLPRFDSPQEFGAAARDALMFLTAGSMYSDVPYKKVQEIREQNRRLGLGLIGLHEFLMKHGVKYGTDDAFAFLEPYMHEYGRALEYATESQSRLGISPSIGTTAVAPNGTIGIIAESTPSGDPLFSAAELRRVVDATPHGNVTRQHVVVDPTAARLVKEGVDPDVIEDTYSLAGVPERRLAMQAFLQKHTDHAISSTVNLPAPASTEEEVSDFGDTLMKFLPDLRGVTVYPNGARAGQPRTPVDVGWALEHEGTVIEGNEETCIGGVCGA